MKITAQNVIRVEQHIQDSDCASYWLKNALKQARERDALDALRDAETLVAVLKARFERIHCPTSEMFNR